MWVSGRCSAQAADLQVGWGQKVHGPRLWAGVRSAPRLLTPLGPADYGHVVLVMMGEAQVGSPDLRPFPASALFVPATFASSKASHMAKLKVNGEGVSLPSWRPQQGCSLEDQGPSVAQHRLLISGSVFLTASPYLVALLQGRKK